MKANNFRNWYMSRLQHGIVTNEIDMMEAYAEHVMASKKAKQDDVEWIERNKSEQKMLQILMKQINNLEDDLKQARRGELYLNKSYIELHKLYVSQFVPEHICEWTLLFDGMNKDGYKIGQYKYSCETEISEICDHDSESFAIRCPKCDKIVKLIIPGVTV